MPNIKSAVKRMRQNRERRILNRSARSRMRTEIKRFRQLVQEGKSEEARALLPTVFSVIDKTARKGKIHANTAARYKSRLSKTFG
jgi:small subunit ribosomal protein S20